MSKKVKLEKSYVREHSLFYTYVWWEANCKKNTDWLDSNIENILFKRPGTKNLLEVWYGSNVVENFRGEIIDKIESDENWFKDLSNEFRYHWDELIDYFHAHQDSPLNIEELEDFHKHWVEWWNPMALCMQIPEISSLPENIKEEALKLREETQEYSDKGDEIYFKSVKNSFPEMKEYFWVLTPEEVFNQSWPDKEKLEERKLGWFLMSDSKSVEDITNLEKRTEEKDFEFEEIDTDKDEIRGNTANGGNAKGESKVVHTVDELEKVKQGDVLVTPMTDPRYVPALKKVSAIVTDEGGITCHAAIVSREMNIPCIIGTKNATEVLSDSNKVEVNADEGIVKIIERND